MAVLRVMNKTLRLQQLYLSFNRAQRRAEPSLIFHSLIDKYEKIVNHQKQNQTIFLEKQLKQVVVQTQIIISHTYQFSEVMGQNLRTTNTTKKALTTPNPQITGLSSYCQPDMHSFIAHSSRFKFKALAQIIVNEKCFCQYCYHIHKAQRNYMTTVCDCGKVHEKCLASYIRRQWKDVKKSENFPYFYLMKCKKCRKKIYFKDNCQENFVSVRHFSFLEVKIFILSLITLLVALGLAVLFGYLAAINESGGVKAIFAILIIFLMVMGLYIFAKIIWNLLHTRFYQQSSEKGDIRQTVPTQKGTIISSENILKDIETQNQFQRYENSLNFHNRPHFSIPYPRAHPSKSIQTKSSSGISKISQIRS